MFATVPLAKLVYSLLLIFLIILLTREAWSVWFDQRIYVSDFEVVGVENVDSRVFAMQIVGSRQVLANRLDYYYNDHPGASASDATYVLPGLDELDMSPETLPGIDITYQSVNFTQIFAALRKKMRAPNEISGIVTSRSDTFQVAVEWPRAPKSIPGGESLKSFITPPLPSLQAAADYVVCSISYANAVSHNSEIAAWSRTQYCDWISALGGFVELSNKANIGAGLNEDDAVRVRQLAAKLQAHYGDTKTLAELYRLRADLLDLLPEGSKSRPELVEAQEDRLRYATLSPELRNLSDNEKRYAAFAQARPAIILPANGEAEFPDNWRSILAPYSKEIKSAKSAVGIVLDDTGSPIGTGFLVGPDLMMTASFVLNNKTSKGAQKLCLGASVKDCSAMLEIGSIVHGTAGETNSIIVAKVSGDTKSINPLELAVRLPQSNELNGRYAFIIGYPMQDSRMPSQFMERLLEKDPGQQRLMPGRILAFGKPLDSSRPNTAPQEFVTDISTTGGTAGGPLVDLISGKVIGVHYAGKWQGERGKFEYTLPVTSSFLETSTES